MIEDSNCLTKSGSLNPAVLRLAKELYNENQEIGIPKV